MAQRVILACALALLWGCSPYGGGEFACTLDSQCGPNGRCADGFCSFPDGNCDSGFRYGDLSGPLSGQCVGGDMPPVDASVDAPDGPPGEVCFGSGFVRACFASAPTGTQTFSSADVITTDNDSLCETTTNAVPACVVAAESITINSGVLIGASGMRPLVLVATQTITINGTLAVGSSRTFNFVGAGADMPGCDAGTPPTGTSGGAGGSFGGAGGQGAAVGTAGIAGAALNVTTLRGGCSGQPGSDNTAPGGRGRGGGAVYLIAETSITVSGAINASGGGGGGGGLSASAGAGGGGSGGFIGLDSPMIANSGSIFANGGGGGEGSGASTSGNNGQDPMAAINAAQGGAGGSNFGTDGGDGSVGMTLNGGAASTVCSGTCTTPGSGGGGGGGAGIIRRFRAASIGGTVSPPAT
ncbi:MAG TPA: hypothetical protein VIV11_14460 [Kofleriaceae bacterium]